MSAPPQGNESFEALLNRIQRGDEQAAATLVEIFGPCLIRTVRRTLRAEIRSKFDSNDFVQAVWASVFASPERLNRIDEPAQLVGLLKAMAHNKVTDENRRRTQTRRRSVHQERRLPTDDEGHDLLTSSTPGPVELAIAREQWHQLVSGQPEHYRQIARLKLAGKTNRSVAEQLGVSEKTVRRVLKRLQHNAQDQRAEDEGAEDEQ